MNLKNYSTKLISRYDISGNIKVFKFEKPLDFTHLPGQFISILVGENLRRSYSLSSHPTDNYIETVIDVSPMGVGSKYLLNLETNSTLSFFGPLGTLVLPQSVHDYSAVNFICSGTGISPFVSMLKDLFISNYSNPVLLLYSEKYKQDFIELAEVPSQIQLYKTLTREAHTEFLYGRVTTHLENLNYSKGSLFYICGKFDMITEVMQLLNKKGVGTERIIVESYYR